MIKAAIEPNPTREFIFGDPFLNAIRPSNSNSETPVNLVTKFHIRIHFELLSTLQAQEVTGLQGETKYSTNLYEYC